MPNYYDELEIEDFAWDPLAKVFHYPCPCGDRFEISKGQLRDGEEIAICPSCSLIVRVIYDYDYLTEEEEDSEGEIGEVESEEVESEDDHTPPTDVSPEPEAEQAKEDPLEEVAKLRIKDDAAEGIGE
ncbi:hypothetical protein IAR55_001784 [Kwoniella newhampshirensis]|uniref:Diphthamide biosynthesis protein 3 n=1 Tax=Kwoniella newhampshirensis TaxID=1651941 RepID=A0AAW0Z319_9TREE